MPRMTTLFLESWSNLAFALVCDCVYYFLEFPSDLKFKNMFYDVNMRERFGKP